MPAPLPARFLLRCGRVFARGAAPLALTALITACGGSGSDADAPALEDEPLWTLQGPELRIGSIDDPDYAFGPVSAMTTLEDGTILTLHGQEQTVRRWSAEGEAAGSFGREGEGPGEFTRAFSMGRFGDTIWVFDRGRASRATFFDGDGELLGTVSARPELGERGMDPNRAPVQAELPSRIGGFYAVNPAFSRSLASGEQQRTTHARLAADGTVPDTLWIQRWERHDVLTFVVGGEDSYTQQPIRERPLIEATPEHLTWVERRVPAQEEEVGRWSLIRVDMRGATLKEATFEYVPEVLPASVADSAIAATSERLAEFLVEGLGLPRAEVDDGVREGAWVPPTRPAVDELFITEDGESWVRLWRPLDDGSREWRVIDPAGRDLGLLRTPPGLRVLHAKGNLVYGIERDGFDVDYIVRYQRVRAGG